MTTPGQGVTEEFRIDIAPWVRRIRETEDDAEIVLLEFAAWVRSVMIAENPEETSRTAYSLIQDTNEKITELVGFVGEFQEMATQMTAQGGPLGMIARAMVPNEQHAPKASKLPRLLG